MPLSDSDGGAASVTAAGTGTGTGDVDDGGRSPEPSEVDELGGFDSSEDDDDHAGSVSRTGSASGDNRCAYMQPVIWADVSVHWCTSGVIACLSPVHTFRGTVLKSDNAPRWLTFRLHMRCVHRSEFGSRASDDSASESGDADDGVTLSPPQQSRHGT